MFQNDPTPEMIPVIGKGTADIAVRTHCGVAAVYDGSDPQALIDFVNDPSLTMIQGTLYRASATGDKDGAEAYTRVLIPKGANIVFRPPAGDWCFLTPDDLSQRYAICVRGSIADAMEAKGIVPPRKRAPAKKAAAPK